MEQIELREDFAIRRLIRTYENQYQDEYDKDNWIKFHYGDNAIGGMKGLKESLQMIGDGEITETNEKSLMYKEMLKDNTLILVVHASLKSSTYGGMHGYKYSIGVYRNNPRTQQIGGGYGASGITSIERTRLLFHDDYDEVRHNRNIISKVCDDIKNYSIKTI
jgi:hypothetical protein